MLCLPGRMYGLVNKAVEDLITSRFGAERWAAVKQRAGVGVEVFVGMEAYPDEVTYRLVAAASEELGLSPAEVLEAFGEYWTLFTIREGYGELLRTGGRTLAEFLCNLHNLHTHVALSFPNLEPPSFWCTDVTEGSLRLHYQSRRPGLAPMVIGLVRGLGVMFSTAVTVALARSRADGHDHDEFVVRFGPAAA